MPLELVVRWRAPPCDAAQGNSLHEERVKTLLCSVETRKERWKGIETTLFIVLSSFQYYFDDC